MSNRGRQATVALLAVALAAALATTCTLNPNIPNARVLCNPNAPQCPSGYKCEQINQASVTIGVCCRMTGCTDNLTPEQIGDIVDAAVSSGRFDAGSDADSLCGNGRLDPTETCDPPGTCPTSCPAVGCELRTLQGSAATCTARCVRSTDQTTCVAGDSCCPTNCNATNDADCASCACGNGRIDTACGEHCDPLNTCPTSCPANGCQLRVLVNADSCQAQCMDDVMQTACVNGDQCCPPGCSAAEDTDCTSKCGNGTVENGETCDPVSSCPASCPQVGCTLQMMQGSANTCTAKCVDNGQQTACTPGDNCCPPGCNLGNDSDCVAICNDGMIQIGETCDPTTTCPTSCPPDKCALKKLLNIGTCQAQCVNDGTQTECMGSDNCCPSGCNAKNDSDCTPSCGNGVVESGEFCDPPSSCPSSCPPINCTKQKLMGSSSQCTAHCVDDTLQTACVDNDMCCPPTCNSTTDSDCQCTCGNGVIESACQETCDPLNTCPTSCPPVQCQLRHLVNGSTCQARCVNDMLKTTCVGNDDCCPSGCNHNNDSDCPVTCGNGVVEAGESCDPPSSCPATCPWSACNRKKLTGMASACTAACVDDGTQTACAPGDGCCPTACNANTDNNCSPVCGNGVIEMGEICDGNCPTSCPNVGCQRRMLQGTGCSAQCVNTTMITTCTNSDSCCPTSCNSTNDNDCTCMCGNNVTETACGEKCDGANCPTSCPPVGCQQRTLQGSACTRECVNTTLISTCTNGDGCCPPACNTNTDNNCTPVCGNSVIEPNETCDPPTTSCQPQFDACVGDNNTIRTRSGVVANCTFQCTISVRPCSATSDGFCPSSCAPCVGSCAATQDIDCKLPDGSTCSNDTQCQGACIDGHCCASTCAPCFQCTGANGTCVAIAKFTEDTVPAGACTGVSSCDGNGTCRLDNGQACGAAGCASGFCADGICCASACSGGCDTCSGAAGTCVVSGAGAAGSPSCSPYLCNGSSGACPTSCTANSQCVSGLFCVANICQKKPLGTPCGGNGECANNNCVDGYCCNSACTGVCETCAGSTGTPGTCGPRSLGSQPRIPPGCNGYACNGSATTTCPPASCSSDSNCDFGYVCNASTCQMCKMTGAACTQAQAHLCCSGACFSFQCQ